MFTVFLLIYISIVVTTLLFMGIRKWLIDLEEEEDSGINGKS